MKRSMNRGTVLQSILCVVMIALALLMFGLEEGFLQFILKFGIWGGIILLLKNEFKGEDSILGAIYFSCFVLLNPFYLPSIIKWMEVGMIPVVILGLVLSVLKNFGIVSRI